VLLPKDRRQQQFMLRRDMLCHAVLVRVLQASMCWSALLCWCLALVVLRVASLWVCLLRAAASWADGPHRSSHNTSHGACSRLVWMVAQ
jgi:hypothetical protein